MLFQHFEFDGMGYVSLFNTKTIQSNILYGLAYILLHGNFVKYKNVG